MYCKIIHSTIFCTALWFLIIPSNFIVRIRRDKNSGVSYFFIKYPKVYVIQYNGMLSASAKLVTRFSPLYLLHSIPPFASYCLRVEQKLHRLQYRPTQAIRYEFNYFHSSTPKRLNTIHMILIVKEAHSTSTCHLTLSRETTLYVCQVCDRLIRDMYEISILSLKRGDCYLFSYYIDTIEKIKII